MGSRPRPERAPVPPAAPLVALLLALAACTPRPEPIAYGSDVCQHCHMGISDPRFGAQLVTRTGRVHKFDSVECLAAYVLQAVSPEQVHSLWVTDFGDPPELVPVEEAEFVHGPEIRSPMGLGLAAFRAGGRRSATPPGEAPGEVLDWQSVLALVDDAWPGGMPRTGHR